MKLDPKFKNNKKEYLFQSFLAFVMLYISLFFLDIFYQGAFVASIGATVVIVFTFPKKNVSSSKVVLGGYLLGMITGIVCFHLIGVLPLVTIKMLAAGAVGIAMLLMILADVEHPPAAAMALSIVIEGYSVCFLLGVLGSLFLFVTIKSLALKWMINLD